MGDTKNSNMTTLEFSVSGFRQEVNDYLKHIVNDGQMKDASIENIDVRKEVAMARVTLNDLTKQWRYVERGEGGDLQLSFLRPYENNNMQRKWTDD